MVEKAISRLVNLAPYASQVQTAEVKKLTVQGSLGLSHFGMMAMVEKPIKANFIHHDWPCRQDSTY